MEEKEHSVNMFYFFNKEFALEWQILKFSERPLYAKKCTYRGQFTFRLHSVQELDVALKNITKDYLLFLKTEPRFIRRRHQVSATDTTDI